MNKRLMVLPATAWLCLYSCGMIRHGNEDSFYNHRNQLTVKSRKGLFASLHVSFGIYRTGEKEKGVDDRIISFKTSRNPFHFSYKDKDGRSAFAECVTTSQDELRGHGLTLFSSGGGEVFYAWIGGGVNKLKNWELVVAKPTYEGLKQDAQTGVFRSVDEVFTVHANNRFSADDSYHNLCLEFRLRGVPVAAVELNGKKKVWLDKHLDDQERFAVAGALAALLMKE